MASPAFDTEFRTGLRAHLATWAGPDDRRGAREVALTVVAYVVALAATAQALEQLSGAGSPLARIGWALTTALSTGCLALLQVRAFLVHHDLCHQSLFRSGRLNLVLALFLGTLASTSSSVWRREHDRHHSDSNNLDRSQDGQTGAWTVEQYVTARPLHRALYWLVNQPPVLFGLVPPLYFLGFMRVAARWYENVLFAGFLAALWATGTLGAFFLAVGPATIVGFFVFHAQHTGPALVRRRDADYDFVENGLVGSTLFVPPRVPLLSPVLDWCLYGVEFHHVHHLHPGIPAWRQRACHEAGAAFFDGVPRITLGGALRATRLALYDEGAGHLVSFEEGLSRARREPVVAPRR